MVSPDSLIVTELEEGIFIEVFLKESSPSALGGQGCCLQSWELLQCCLPVPLWDQKQCGKGTIPCNTAGGTHAWDSSEVQAQFTQSPDFPITPTLSLIFQISSKSKHQNIFVLMRHPTAQGGENTSWGEIQTWGVLLKISSPSILIYSSRNWGERDVANIGE